MCNGLDDDLDRLLDCEDPDCAWFKDCLSAGLEAPYEVVNCAFSEATLLDEFSAETVSIRPGLCNPALNEAGFGGQNLICGPPLINPSVGFAERSRIYQLTHWNLIAEEYCAEPEKRILN